MTTSNGVGDYHVLIVEDNANECQALAALLAHAGYRISTADSADKALGYLEEPIHFVITDLEMGDLSGLDLLKYWKAKSPETMFLMMTGHGSTQTAIDAIKAGAYHYMTKPLDVSALLIMLQNMIRQREDSRKVTILQDRLNEKCGLDNIVGRSSQMQRVFELIRRSSQAFSTVLILGESGTGKELVAEAIHQNSPRRNGPFNAFNCAAMPAGLVESELFGHGKGAFTGAIDRRMGRFEAAHGGTLFIDEIGDFDVSLQVKLLRVMENRTVTAVGGSKEIKVDTRVVAATSRNIRDMIAKGQFREDLYYRLNVITIELPPLRERLDDIPLLVKRFMDRVNAQNGSKVTSITPAVIDALQQYHWPGNARELLNVVERMIVLSDKNTLDVEDLPTFIRKPSAAGMTRAPGAPAVAQPALLKPPASSSASSDAVSPAVNPAPESANQTANVAISAESAAAVERLLENMTLDQLEKMAIDLALRRFNNHRTRAARALGISVRTLQRKLNPGMPQDRQSDEDAAKPPENIGLVGDSFRNMMAERHLIPSGQS